MKSTLIKNALLVAAFSGWTSAALAVGLTVTPNVITNDYVGKITITITGLTPGQAVLIEKYGDLNANGVIDAGEPAVQAGLVTDGSLPIIGGVRNLNVPGDEDGAANGQVRIELSHPGVNTGLDVFAGKYLIKVSNPVTYSALATSSFEVKQKNFFQGVSGRLTASGTGTALAYASVVLLPPQSNPVTGTVTDADGNYTLYGPPGNYTVLALAPGFVSDFTGSVTVSTGAFATRDLALPAATRTISGKLKDSSSAMGIPGVMIQAESAGGQWVSAFSRSDGTYSIGVLAGSWSLDPSTGSLSQLGYLAWDNKTNVNITTLDVPNLDLPVDQSTALIYGTVKNNQNNPVMGVGIWANDQPNRQYDTSGTTFLPNADYCVGVRPGNWWVAPDSDSLNALGYTGQGTNVTLTANQAMRVDFILGQVNAHLIGRVVDNTAAAVGNIGFGASDHQSAWTSVNTDGNGNFNLGVSGGTWYLQLSDGDAQQRQLISPQLQITLTNGETRSNIVVIVQHVTGQITGSIRNNNSNLLTNIAVYSSLNLNGTNYSGYIRTDANGYYQLPAFNGTWLVSLDCNYLQSLGYSCADPLQATVSGGNVTRDFVVQPAAPLQITTTSLPNGAVGASYSAQLNATGGAQPYSWSLAPGSASLPNGLSLGANGQISGTPTTTTPGPSYFFVRVTDNLSYMVDQYLLSITIPALPLQVTTSSLPNGVTSVSYSAQLEASGGQTPYSWLVIVGALPGGLTMNSSGLISGTPSATGTFNFTARVTDANTTTASRSLSITVNPALQITTSSLPSGGLAASYSAQLQATGGQTPYAWSVISGALPGGLTLNSSGLISGTPSATGTFSFTARVADAASGAATRNLSITVNAVLQISTTSPLASAAVGQSYSATMQATGGQTPYTWSLALGSAPLPGGLTLSSGGDISGIPTTAGTNTFIIRVTDSASQTTSKPLTMAVNATLPRLSITYPNASSVAIRWPLPADGFALEETASLSGTITWQGVVTTPAVVDGQSVVTLSIQTGQRFFRLHKP